MGLGGWHLVVVMYLLFGNYCLSSTSRCRSAWLRGKTIAVSFFFSVYNTTGCAYEGTSILFLHISS